MKTMFFLTKYAMYKLRKLFHFINLLGN